MPGIKSTIIVSCALFFILGLVHIPYAYSQVAVNNTNATTGKAEQVRMNTYENQEWGISIQYPFYWLASTGFSYPDIVGFYSPLENLSDFLPPAQVVLSLTKFQKNISLSEYTNRTLAALYDTALQANQTNSTLRQEQSINSTKASEKPGQALIQNQAPPRLNIRSSDSVTIAGYPGIRVLYIVSPPQDISRSFGVMQIWTIVEGNKLYSLVYSADHAKFLKYLPDATLIINSLTIAKSTL